MINLVRLCCKAAWVSALLMLALGGPGCGTPAADNAGSGQPGGEDASTTTADPSATGPGSDLTEVEVPEGWGDLKMRFVYDGQPPPRQKLNVTKDEFCTANPPLSELLVVSPENRGIANVVVSLFLRRGAKPPEAHPSFDEQAATAVVLDNRDCRFQPHVLSLRAGQTLRVTNSDPMGHNTKFDSLRNGSFNSLIPPGESFEKKVTAGESHPVPVMCNIHPWMSARLIITDHPYVGISDEDGQVTIKNLPSGHWRFQLRHADSVYLRDVTIGQAKTDSRGTAMLTIQPDQNDFGDVNVPGELLRN